MSKTTPKTYRLSCWIQGTPGNIEAKMDDGYIREVSTGTVPMMPVGSANIISSNWKVHEWTFAADEIIDGTIVPLWLLSFILTAFLVLVAIITS